MSGDSVDILLATWSGGGNVNPLLALGCQLVEAGHRVRAIGPADGLGERFEAADLPYRAHRTGDEWTGGNPIDYSSEEGPTDEQFMAYLRGMADDVGREISANPTDALIIDYMQPDALSVAEASGLPFAALVHTLYTGVAVGGDFSPMMAMADLGRLNIVRGELGLDNIEPMTALLDRADRVLVTTFEELDRPGNDVPTNVRFVGPLLEDVGPDEGWTPPGTASQGPLVVVSLGTTEMENERVVLQNVLDATRALPIRIFASVGDHLDPASFDTGPTATVSSYVHHRAVLPHAAAMVTHAGLGVVNAALANGLPQVCLPLGRDQPDNASRLVALGAGIALDADSPRDEIAQAVQAILDDGQYRAAVERISSTFDQSTTGSLALANIEEMLADSR